MSTRPLSRRQSLAALAGAWVVTPAQAVPLLRTTRPLFGSPADLLLTRDADALTVAAVWAGLTAMNERWNAWKPRGLGPLNQALREGRAVKVDPALRQLIDGAARLEALSGGLFNAGMGGLVNAWGFHDDVLRPGARPAARQQAAGCTLHAR